MNAAVVDTNVLITFLEKGNKVCELLSRFDRLLVPAAVDAEFRAGIDLLTGRVYAFSKENQIVVPAGVVFIDVPVYDSPCVLTERSAVEITR